MNTCIVPFRCHEGHESVDDINSYRSVIFQPRILVSVASNFLTNVCKITANILANLDKITSTLKSNRTEA